MDITYIDLAAFLVTYLFFGYTGYQFSPKLKQPGTIKIWLIYIIITILAGGVGSGTRLISIFEFAIYLNWILQGFFIGILIEFVVRFIKEKRAKKITTL